MSQWRTFWGELAIGAMMLAALCLCPREARAGVVVPVVGCLSTLGFYLAGKSAIQHATAKAEPPK